ncbi:beta-carotene hydroxylase [Hibiscus syriacus]|uniref:Beta-carotene hydroxylase n=1 Tax=Hibiscus syriacus TaxID=106335 RepID=A0A6A2XFP4_HIBSY|nr:beta-carotene hydroxylase [Hibiscus syriacus]
MAYRRRQQQGGILPSAPATDDLVDVEVDTAKAIRGSSARLGSSLSAAYGYSSLHSSSAALSTPTPTPTSTATPTPKESEPHQYASLKNLDESKQGFWGSLARKAKAFLDDDNEHRQFEPGGQAKSEQHQGPTPDKYRNVYQLHDRHNKTDNPTLQKGLGAIASTLNYLGKSVEEGLTIVENRTAGIIQETRKHIRKKHSGSMAPNHAAKQPQMQHQARTSLQADLEIQLKASRDVRWPLCVTGSYDGYILLSAIPVTCGFLALEVAMAMAAKAKLLLRELKTVKADLAFAKERCAQLEEENRILRENHERGDNPDDDELIRLQLETLLAEKARLAHENSIYARENRFLREVVEYHQLTMQDVVYLDESTEEVTEVYPIKVPSLPNMNSVPATSIALSSEAFLDASLRLARNIPVNPVPPP